MKGNLILRILFLLAAIGGVVLVFVVSWFWRLLLIPMIIILVWDVIRSYFSRKKEK